MTESPVETLRRAAEAAPKVLPAGVGEAAATMFDLLRQWSGIPSTVAAGGAALAAEVLALAEQQQARLDTPAIALMRPDRKVLAVLDNPQFEECYQLVGIGEPVDGHSWARPSELDGWIPLMPAQDGEQ